ncbi:MAG: hypothetical protein AMJ43_11260 [Coxiella sp. DG_40]|nr:MAG: hypothetical protein AMJ43_11260 [Coxiella sp. DG_40]
MHYYVGIRESLIDRARRVSSAALGEDFSAHFVRPVKNSPNCKKRAMPTTAQALDLHGLTQTQATRRLINDP